MDHHHHHNHHNNHHHDDQHHHHLRHNHHHHHNHHQPPPPPPQSIYSPHMISLPNYSSSTSNHRFPFPSSPPPPQPPHTAAYSSAIPGVGGGGYDIDVNSQKKKRGRPRKYSPDNGGIGGGGGGGGGGGIALGLSPTPMSPGGGGGGGGGGGDSSGATPSSENSSRKNRGRPPSSSRKQLDALGNCGVGFTPHVILVNAGEDIASKIVEFSKQGERTICVLSANGSISNVDLRQPAMSGGVVKYEGQFEIISLSGSFLFSQNSGGQVRTGGLCVSLADSDGRVLGGGVVGILRAATHVQIIVGSFIADGKKPKYMPTVPLSHTPNFSGQLQPAADTSPASQEVSTEGSDENGSNHIDRNTGSYGNSNHPMHHNMQMYSHMNWPNPGSKML